MSNHGPVSLPLHKLSFCTTATLHSKMVWEHLSGGTEMFAVFDHVRQPGLGRGVSEKQVLKLVRDGHLLVCTLEWSDNVHAGIRWITLEKLPVTVKVF